MPEMRDTGYRQKGDRYCGARGRDLKCEGLFLHDTRRTAARNFRRAGVAEGVIMRIGGWKTRSVFDRYAIVSQADVVDALQKLEKRKEDTAREVKKSEQRAIEFGHDSVMTRPCEWLQRRRCEERQGELSDINTNI